MFKVISCLFLINILIECNSPVTYSSALLSLSKFPGSIGYKFLFTPTAALILFFHAACAGEIANETLYITEKQLSVLVQLNILVEQILEIIQQLTPKDWILPDLSTVSITIGTNWLTNVLIFALLLILLLLFAYTLRHYHFTLNRLFGRQRHPYIDIDTANWPMVTVFIAAHNEETVIAGSLSALLEVDYPIEKLTLMPVNDRSTDKTREIIDDFVSNHPGRIHPFHRTSGKPGKAAALKDATELIDSEVIIIFDADYLPSRGLIKQLVAPFFDPEVGAVMGRVVPQNVDSNLLTRLLDLERSGGYQVDQQARMNMGLVPQYGGTVGGIRRRALENAGGWHDDVLAEDTDMTVRLLLKNWKTVYQNRSECYEEVPEVWPVRVRQIKRWAKGHNQALYRHFWKVFFMRGLPLREKLDALALLGVYAMSPLLMLGWGIAIVLFYLNLTPLPNGTLSLFAMVAFSGLGNFAAFFEIAAAVFLDGNQKRIRLLPLTFIGFLVSIVSIAMATMEMVFEEFFPQRELKWDKTPRYRKLLKDVI
jgi:cellulose synthase/poly-beta-1,6-N-acetylglucosamine synthase-like glycosyltransferase